MMTRNECEALLAIAVQSSDVDEVFATLNATDSCSRSIAGRLLLPPHRMRNTEITVTVRKGRRYAMASGNVYDETSVRDLVARAGRHAQFMPEAPEIIPFPGTVDSAESPMYREMDISRGVDGFERALETFLVEPSFDGMRVFGSATSASSSLALASSGGLFLYQPSSLANAHLRCFSDDGMSTGFSERYAVNPADLDLREVLESSARGCGQWRNPSDIKPGRITTVFEPRALADLLRPLLQQFSRRAIEQDQSFLRRLDGTSFLGTKLFHESVNFRSDPFDARVPSMPFTSEGQSVHAEDWVSNGVIAQLVTDRYDARKSASAEVAPPTNLIMDAAAPVSDIVASTEYGLLVRGFANLNILDPKNCLLSGSTRDGVFLIENGKITKPVKNLVLRETPVYLLKEILAMGHAELTSTTGSYFPMLLPSIRVKDVMFTQLSGLV